MKGRRAMLRVNLGVDSELRTLFETSREARGVEVRVRQLELAQGPTEHKGWRKEGIGYELASRLAMRERMSWRRTVGKVRP